jgi:hypothetical protein
MSKCTAEKIAKCTEKDKICNPATGRCVKKDGKIGKELMKAKKSKSKSKKPKKSKKSKTKPKPREDFERVWPKPPKKSKAKSKKSKSKKICLDHQILNPATGRCVKKDGKIGKQILAKKPAKPAKPGKKPGKKPAKSGKKPAKSGKKKYVNTYYYPTSGGLKVKIKIEADKILPYPTKKIQPSDGWDIVKVKKESTLLFRGEPTTRTNTLLSNMEKDQISPTWYTDVLSNSIGYLPSGAGKTNGGTLYVYTPKKDLNLLNLNSAANFNKLYAMFYDKNTDTYEEKYYWMRSNREGTNTPAQQAKIRTGKSMSEILYKVFVEGGLVNSQRCMNKTGNFYNSKKCKRVRQGTVTQEDLNRGSDIDGDYIFADWLCHNGFDGWIQPAMKGQIPPEFMLCKPKNSVKLVTSIHYPKGVGSKMGLKGKKNIYKGVKFFLAALRQKLGNDFVNFQGRYNYYQDYDRTNREKLKQMQNPEKAANFSFNDDCSGGFLGLLGL